MGISSACFAGPGRPSASVEIAWGRKDMERGHWTGALSHFRKALARDPRSADAYAEVGRAYHRLGDILRSKEAYTAALKINPHNDQAETGLHDVMSHDEHEQMMADIETRVKASPNDPDLLTTYAEELFERERFGDAQKAAQTALSINPKESHAEGVLGLLAFQQNRKDDALRLLKEATKADAYDDDSWAGLGDLYTSLKDYPNAVACYRHAVSAAPRPCRVASEACRGPYRVRRYVRGSRGDGSRAEDWRGRLEIARRR